MFRWKKVITWTLDDNYQGGTIHALRIASTYDVPVFDIRRRQDQSDMMRYIMEVENRKAKVTVAA